MNHRHLLPDEIDLLLDDEVGFGVQPLRAHARACDECQARLAAARLVVEALEDAPRFAPAHSFADRVMSQVPVFEPWHVTARETAMRWLPAAGPARWVVGVIGTSVASVLTVLILWVATQTDALQLAGGLAGDRLRSLALTVAREFVTTVFGDQVFAVVAQAGTVGIVVALVGLALAAVGSVVGLRAVAVASSRRRD